MVAAAGYLDPFPESALVRPDDIDADLKLDAMHDAVDQEYHIRRPGNDTLTL